MCGACQIPLLDYHGPPGRGCVSTGVDVTLLEVAFQHPLFCEGDPSSSSSKLPRGTAATAASSSPRGSARDAIVLHSCHRTSALQVSLMVSSALSSLRDALSTAFLRHVDTICPETLEQAVVSASDAAVSS